MGIVIDSFSLFNAVAIYNLALVLIYLLRRQSQFLTRCGAGPILFAMLLAALRLALPINFQQVYILHSEKLMPAVNSALKAAPLAVFPTVSVGKLVLVFWFAGACCVAGKYMLEVYMELRSRKVYLPSANEAAEQAARRLGIKYPVLISAQVSAPHTAGFFRPVIYLPDTELSPKEWEYILRHENQHIRARDVWIKLFYAVLEAVMWWNPVSHLFMRELDSMLELRCDAALAAGLSESERLEYLSTMLSVVKRAAADSPEAVSAYFARRGKYLKERFDMVLNMGKRADRKVKYAVCAAVLAVFCMSYSVVVQPRYRPPIDPEMFSKNEDDDEQFITFDGENYFLWADGRFVSTLSEKDITKEPYNAMAIYREIR